MAWHPQPTIMTKIDLTDSLEKIPVKIFPDSGSGSAFVAKEIAALIKEKEAEGKKPVIGLATGSSPKNIICRAGAYA